MHTLRSNWPKQSHTILTFEFVRAMMTWMPTVYFPRRLDLLQSTKYANKLIWTIAVSLAIKHGDRLKQAPRCVTDNNSVILMHLPTKVCLITSTHNNPFVCLHWWPTKHNNTKVGRHALRVISGRQSSLEMHGISNLNNTAVTWCYTSQ